MNNLCWNEDLVCHWSAWRVISEQHLVLELPSENVCDMGGAIKIAQSLCPDVDTIDVYSGDVLDVQYRFDSDDEKWKAFVPRRSAEN